MLWVNKGRDFIYICSNTEQDLDIVRYLKGYIYLYSYRYK